MAFESSGCAASILAERTMRVGIDMLMQDRYWLCPRPACEREPCGAVGAEVIRLRPAGEWRG